MDDAAAFKVTARTGPSAKSAVLAGHWQVPRAAGGYWVVGELARIDEITPENTKLYPPATG